MWNNRNLHKLLLELTITAVTLEKCVALSVHTEYIHAYEAPVLLTSMYLTKIYTCVDRKTCAHE